MDFSLTPEQMAFHLYPGSLQPVSRVDCAGNLVARARLRVGGPEYLRDILFRQGHDTSVLVPADVFPGRPAGRLPLLPLCANPAAREDRGRDAHIDSRTCRRR